MRVTGGILGGRSIRVPGRRVRPTTDRVREAVFASLGERVVGARVLDLFAGSGALGLEAWSRGAAEVWWVEDDPRVFQGLRRNVRELCGDGGAPVRCVERDVIGFLRSGVFGPRGFDLVLLDPPYDRPGRPSAGPAVLEELLARPVLADEAWVVLEQSVRSETPPLGGWERLRDKTYGETRVFLLTRSRTP